MKEKESNRDRFIRLGTIRTNAVLKRLQVLGNCANRSVYDYTEEEINKIFAEIEKAVRNVKAKFHYPNSRKREFKL